MKAEDLARREIGRYVEHAWFQGKLVKVEWPAAVLEEIEKEPVVVAARNVLAQAAKLRQAASKDDVAKYAFALGRAACRLELAVKERKDTAERAARYSEHCERNGKAMKGEIPGFVQYLIHETGLSKTAACERAAVLFKVSRRHVWRQCQGQKIS